MSALWIILQPLLVRFSVRLPARRFSAVLALTLSFCLLAPQIAGALPKGEWKALDLVDKKRKKSDRSELRVCDDLNRVAERWSIRMARSERLRHNPDARHQISRWSRYAENVGTASSVKGAMKAFLDSPGHKRNMLSGRYTETGIGIIHDEGRFWITQVFRRPTGSACRD
jgi:uncharacterized protein YkwD